MKRISRVHDIALYLGVGTLFTHELDAMTHHEWRILPLTSWLPEAVGEDVFVLMHVPLFAIVVALIASTKPSLRQRSRFWVAVFLLVHAGLHTLFWAFHPAYAFGTVMAHALIYGAAGLGAAYLCLPGRAASETAP